MFVSRMLLDSYARSARVYCRSEREQGQGEPFSLSCSACTPVPSHEEPDSAESGSLYYRVGRPPQRDVDFRRETSRTLNRNFERNFFFPRVRTLETPSGRDRSLVTTTRPRFRCYEEMVERKRNELA